MPDCQHTYGTPDEWTDAQNRMFSLLHRYMVTNKAVFLRPGHQVTDEQFQTIAHNAAWMAAVFLETDEARIIDAETQQVLAESPRSLNA